ncbi:MAG: 5-(carboxyamino)imidazole ribonucleotide synthase [Anaerolineales bacterium]|nr:5-(carboxyamino)imidazole ribonucleotide synthase [Anaerolineales bacterium]MCB9128527.1 5-(carboxyamino)imidazole ribonucleotide synthase [Ardenticatenales bacterium]
MKETILPPATIGILGSGQLGRMLAIEARKMGYGVQVLSPDRNSPTGQIADKEWVAAYDDLERVRQFAQAVDVITHEFENVPAATVDAAADFVPVRPSRHVLHVAQNRAREKSFFAAEGLPVAPFRAVETVEALRVALAEIGTPAILKTAAFGYDGKGQTRIDDASDVEDAWQTLGDQPCVLEAFVPFERELSVVAARGMDGRFVHYGAIENDHQNHILDFSIAPARVPEAVATQAVALAREVLEGLAVVGVLCVEYFLQGDGILLVNEIAPRPHNSGHLTFDAAITSQFEQQLRAVCGLPLGDTTLPRPAAMANLLGDLWQQGEPAWARALAVPGVKLHLYGKADARVGRKMGHLTATAPTVEEAVARVQEARSRLQRSDVAE